MKNFWYTLFEPGEQLCMGNTVYDTKLSDHGPLKSFFSINPLHTSRKDSNVTSYRNILVEFDSGTISEQLEYLKTSGMPYSTLVHSGGKSLHAVISVEPAFATEAEYRTVATAILKKTGGDPACKNPSRFSRTPRAFRDNGVEQKLIEVKARVPLAELLAWTGPIEPSKAISEQPKGATKAIPIFVYAYLIYGVEKERNTALFKNSCELFRAGFDEDEIFYLVVNSPCDLPEREIRTCIRSARKASNAG